MFETVFISAFYGAPVDYVFVFNRIPIWIGFVGNHRPVYQAILAGLFGFIGTLIYNIATNLAYPLSAGYSLKETFAYGLSGILFTAMHLASNTAIFSVVVPGYLRKMKL